MHLTSLHLSQHVDGLEIYEARPGCHILAVVNEVIEWAKHRGGIVALRFNGTVVSVQPTDTPEMIIEAWIGTRELAKVEPFADHFVQSVEDSITAIQAAIDVVDEGAVVPHIHDAIERIAPSYEPSHQRTSYYSTSYESDEDKQKCEDEDKRRREEEEA